MEPGTRVRIKADPGRIGVITGKRSMLAGRVRWQVVFPDTTTFVLENQLEPVQLLDDPVELLRQGRLGRARDLRATLTHIRLSGRLANVIYSMETTNTDFYPYQFKPVLTFLDAPGNGLLIADEVGLGKTIEAGLIWTELRSRFDTRRLLVLCPSALQEKWRSELSYRFGINAEVVGARDLERRLDEVRVGRHSECALIGSFQGLRPRRGWDGDDPPSGPGTSLARFLQETGSDQNLVDLLIIDEAHYLRNPESMTARLGRLLRNVSEHAVLLSATPIHLRSQDLFQLLNLVDEDTFNRPDTFDEILQANEPLVRAREEVLRNNLGQGDFVQLLEGARRHPLLGDNRQIAGLISKPPTSEELAEPQHRTHIASRLESVNLLSKAVTRMRKKEVTEWRVVREAVAETITLSAPEREFYDNVTALVRRFAAERAGHEGFLLVTPQRQMSSSMPAALRAWQTRYVGSNDEADEDVGVDIDQESDVGPLVAELTRQAHGLGDLHALWQCDSKYQRLSQMLKQYLSQHPEEKVVLFAYFRPTLSYLQERLSSEGIQCQVLTGATGPNKQEAINAFRDSKGTRVLLSSEVASEGVDLQFARVVINYDLPWNPMKVEQRIGRVDRLGQKAPTVTIWNVFYDDTIDARIYHRLYERLGIFERALGGLEPILGEKIRALTLDLLLGMLTPEQEEERIEQTALAIATQRNNEEELEEKAGNLIAHGDYILNQVRAARELRRWITGEDLWLYVRDFLEKHYKGTEFRQVKPDDLVFEVRLSPEARADLEAFLRDQRLTGWTRLIHHRGAGLRCRFHNRVGAGDAGAVEDITQFHPLVRFVSRQLRNSDDVGFPVVSVRLGRTELRDIPVGDYVFSVDKWSVQGLRNVERLCFIVRPLQGSGVQAPLPDSTAEQLVTAAARHGDDWLSAKNEVDISKATFSAAACLDESEGRYAEYIEQLELENNDRADVQSRSLMRHRDRQLKRLEEVRERHRLYGRASLITATEGRIAALRQRIEQRLFEIDRARVLQHHRQEVCIGLIRIW